MPSVWQIFLLDAKRACGPLESGDCDENGGSYGVVFCKSIKGQVKAKLG